jgi:hypothetical protein
MSRTGNVNWQYFVMFDEARSDEDTIVFYAVDPGYYPPQEFFNRWCNSHPVLVGVKN